MVVIDIAINFPAVKAKRLSINYLAKGLLLMVYNCKLILNLHELFALPASSIVVTDAADPFPGALYSLDPISDRSHW